MAHVKIKQDSKQAYGATIEIDGVPAKDVVGLDVSMHVDRLSSVHIIRYIEPEIEIEADVSYVNICKCCGQIIEDKT